MTNTFKNDYKLSDQRAHCLWHYISWHGSYWNIGCVCLILFDALRVVYSKKL